MLKKYDNIVIGEGGPAWTSLSKASMATVMNAIIRTGSELTSTYVMDPTYTRSTVLYALKVPSENLAKFKELCPYPVTRHPDIQVGHEIARSVKQVIYEVGE